MELRSVYFVCAMYVSKAQSSLSALATICRPRSSPSAGLAEPSTSPWRCASSFHSSAAAKVLLAISSMVSWVT